MSVSEPPSFVLPLTEEERVQLILFLEREFRDTHVEARRTESPEYQKRIHHEEDVLRGVINKLRRP
jgi:hypothetical protein